MEHEWRLPECVCRDYLRLTKRTLAIQCEKDGTVLAHNPCAPRLLGERHTIVGRNLASLISRTDRKDLDLAHLAVSGACVPLALTAERSGDAMQGYLVPEGEGLFLVAELLGTESDVAEQLGTLVNEISDMGRDLRQRNRELVEANRMITELSRTDPLTSLANRRYFMERLAPSLAMSRRHGLPLCLFMADLDHFKSVNDTHGHAMGDRILVAFSDLLREQCRAEDLACRFGGEEIVAMLPATSPAEGATVAERLRARFAERSLALHGIACTVSIGVAAARVDDTPETLIVRADKTLYLAKSLGRNRVALAPEPECR